MLFLITWTSQWLWKELKKQLEEKWHTVIGTYRKRIVDWLHPLDLTSQQSVDIFVKYIRDTYGQIDYLINNAAVMMRGQKIPDQSRDDINNQVQTNITGTIYLTAQLLPIITTWVVNICSKVVQRIIAWSSTYIATKHGLDGFTESLKLEYPDLDIRAVYPGRIATEMGGGKGEDVSDVAKGIVGEII